MPRTRKRFSGLGAGAWQGWAISLGRQVGSQATGRPVKIDGGCGFDFNLQRTAVGPWYPVPLYACS